MHAPDFYVDRGTQCLTPLKEKFIDVSFVIGRIVAGVPAGFLFTVGNIRGKETDLLTEVACGMELE